MGSHPLPPTLAALAAGVLLTFACTTLPNDGSTEAGAVENSATAGGTTTDDGATGALVMSRLTLADFTLRFPSPPEQARLGCTEPKPPDSACSAPCKPCLQWRCVDGEWKLESLDWGILCESPVPKDSDSGPADQPVICPRAPLSEDPDDGGFCPLGCDICF